MTSIDAFLNRITVYRLMLYYLIFLVVVASILSGLSILPYNFIDIILNTLYLVISCWVINQIFSRIFKVNTNLESAFISGLILSLIAGSVGFLSNIFFLTALSFFAMASKYLIAFRKKHIFNPVAFGVVATAAILGQGVSWWVGNLQMFPFVLLGGLLMLRKLRRYELVGIFLLIYLLLFLFVRQAGTFNLPNILLYSPIIFFSFVMLVEPLTSPQLKNLQILYGVVIAASTLVIPLILPNVFYGLELSLLIGNIFSYIVSHSFRQVLTLKEKKHLTTDVIAFHFEPTRKFQFKAGQFLEWTLQHLNPDSRGVRRYFTIASSPTEDFVMLTSKFYEKPSTFKKALMKMEVGGVITVSSLGGDFTLSDDPSKKLVFIAGGIGITPFRSMVKWLIDNKESSDIVLLYSNKTQQDIVFKEIFDQAKDLGVRTVYVNTDKMGYIDAGMIKKEIPDWKQSLFYVSGPEPMVQAFEKMLSKMGLSRDQIKRDYFPGYTETHQKA